MNISELKAKIEAKELDGQLVKLYGESQLEMQRFRYAEACDEFAKTFPERKDAPVELFSAPGRTEICGNHTDHQHGCVLAAAVDLDVIGIAAYNDSSVIRIKSSGYDMDTVDISDLTAVPGESGTSASLIRGVAAGCAKYGTRVCGFDAYTTSNVLSGSGLSSSAAFEILLGTMIDDKADPVELAKIGQFAENEYFGKKSGLMDQTACAVGGAVFIDFENTDAPKIQSSSFDLDKYGYTLFITDTKGSHADLSDDYSAIPGEMISVAKAMGKDYLRQCDEEEFYAKLAELRKSCSDRAIIRAGHFFTENKRAAIAAKAIESGSIAFFLDIIKKSGRSSAMWLQNLYSTKAPLEQGITLALAMSEKTLHGAGAYRVHGGGFAGTIQAFVPNELAETYRAAMDGLFGAGSCIALRIRSCGGIKLCE
ncbi:MAG: galactokinase [Ruminiclostridium sp.]|nr:galactokinase [Ruminiclostridium sp.]